MGSMKISYYSLNNNQNLMITNWNLISLMRFNVGKKKVNGSRVFAVFMRFLCGKKNVKFLLTQTDMNFRKLRSDMDFRYAWVVRGICGHIRFGFLPNILTTWIQLVYLLYIWFKVAINLLELSKVVGNCTNSR